MILLIDAGNTRTKWAWAAGAGVTAPLRVNAFENALFYSDGAPAAFTEAVACASLLLVSNVAGPRWLTCWQQLRMSGRVQVVTAPEHYAGLVNRYECASQLGSDRWLALLAVWRHYGRSALIASAGTALTLDALQLAADGQSAAFIGGSIQPGLQLMWASMQQGAAQLDYALDADATQSGRFATNTPQAMLQGCYLALCGAVMQQYDKLASPSVTSPLLILTGGDAADLYACLPAAYASQAMVVSDLVLAGLAIMAESAT